MSGEKQSISSEEVGSLEETLGDNDPVFRPVSVPDGKSGPDPEPASEPESEDPTEHYRRKKGIS